MINYILAAMLIGLQAFDFWSTNKILSKGGMELNSLLRWIMRKIGVLPTLTITKVPLCILIGLAVVIYPSNQMLSIVLGLVNLYYIVILYKNNFRTLLING
uniref:Uncharacterized protein n=1 Tax=viral metagenome TaxID=1070528 RepID=A0A6H1ZIZ7_9ZZZZ